MKYKDWLNEWLNTYIEPFLKPRTHRRYKYIVTNYLNPYLGDFEIDDLSPLIIQKFIKFLIIEGNKKEKTGLSTNSVNSIITIIKTTLKLANNFGVSQIYIGKKIIRPKNKQKNIVCFSLSEQKKIELAALFDKRKKMLGIIICLYSGLRIGELLALQWSDIDFSEKTININKTAYDDIDSNLKSCIKIGTPKTQSSIRKIPIPKPIIKLLKELKAQSKSIFVVSDKKQKQISIRSYQKSFELMLKKLKICKKGFHSLRHTFATRAIECGMDIKTLSEILGHKNPNTTLTRYVHSMNEHKISMMNKLGSLFLKF